MTNPILKTLKTLKRDISESQYRAMLEKQDYEYTISKLEKEVARLKDELVRAYELKLKTTINQPKNYINVREPASYFLLLEGDIKFPVKEEYLEEVRDSVETIQAQMYLNFGIRNQSAYVKLGTEYLKAIHISDRYKFYATDKFAKLIGLPDYLKDKAIIGHVIKE